ncbi:hypothetical protein [Methanothrix sp.]|jgi:hypothetical protein|uniref:hypothetical protein n=1 Tax=Methanothrix sp. TaxID=90426 RepID=UPI0027B434C5|nr:hypothetical protein [Euryarchaeota archaeon]
MDEKIGATNANKAECSSGCKAACCCSSNGISKRGKIILCLIVAIAAVIVIAHGIIQKAEAESDMGQNPSDLSLWSEPAASLASLNQVAAQKDVFLYLPLTDQGPDDKIKDEIELAASKAQSQGRSIAFFALDQGSEDYGQLTSQVPAPFVLVINNGCNLSSVPSNITTETGMSIVSGDISEENLLYALVAASRPTAGCCSLPSTKCC